MGHVFFDRSSCEPLDTIILMAFVDDLPRALKHFRSCDEDLAQIIAQHGPPPPRKRPANFPTLLHIILAQQISVAAAAAIEKRLKAAVPRLTPTTFMQLSEEELRLIGFSRQKILYGKDLALSFLERGLTMQSLRRAGDEAVIQKLVAIKGLGRWSAEVFLLFALERPDVMPAQDLALMVAAQRLKKLKTRPAPKQLLALAENWRPWRSYAARLLWHFYNAPPA